MSFWEVLTLIIWFVWPVIIFESIRTMYMTKKFKSLTKKVNLLSKAEYEAEDKRNIKKGNMFRVLWILWAVFWIIELVLY